jgi:hypothetical protein
MLLTVLLGAWAGLVLPALGQAHPRWHGHIDRFHKHDIVIWRGGHWFHGRHAHRFGWWWVVDGLWYWYPAPVFPYPDPYTPPIIVQTLPTTPPPPPQPPAPVWYYCAQPAGYYPYVPECPSGWKTVPARPPTGPAPAAQAPAPSIEERR